MPLDPVQPSKGLTPLDPEGRYPQPASPELFNEFGVLDEALDSAKKNIKTAKESSKATNEKTEKTEEAPAKQYYIRPVLGADAKNKVALSAIGRIEEFRSPVETPKRIRRLAKTLNSISDVIDDYEKYSLKNKVRSRKSVELGDVADETMTFVREGVGRVRTEAFNADKILDLIPVRKPLFKTKEKLRSIEAVGNDIIYAKTKALSASSFAERITNSVKNPTKEESDMLEGYFTKADMEGMMFLDTTKGFVNTEELVQKTMKEFNTTIIDKDSFAKHHLLQ